MIKDIDTTPASYLRSPLLKKQDPHENAWENGNLSRLKGSNDGNEVPLILGRPFFAFVGVRIDYEIERMILLNVDEKAYYSSGSSRRVLCGIITTKEVEHLKAKLNKEKTAIPRGDTMVWEKIKGEYVTSKKEGNELEEKSNTPHAVPQPPKPRQCQA
ncbi:unnamed protein product [Cochlearia groenlandica]